MTTASLRIPLLTGSALVLVTATLLLASQSAREPGVGALRYPAESAGRIVERHLEFYAGYERTPAWERWLHGALFGDREAVIEESLQAYREVLALFARKPAQATPWAEFNTRARLVVTLAESGRLEELRVELADLGESPEAAVLGDAVRSAYLGEPVASGPGLLRTAPELMPLGWAADRLRMRLAEREARWPAWNWRDARLRDQGARWRSRTLWLAGAVAALIGLGLGLLAAGRRWPRPASVCVLDAPWPLYRGLAVAVHALAAGLLIVLGLDALLPDSYFRPHWLSQWAMGLAALPMLWLMQRQLLRPAGSGLVRGFGLAPAAAARPALLATTLGLLALNLLGALLIAWLTWRLGIGPHWAEGLQERVIFGPWETTATTLIATVLWIPIAEEFAFRGLLYVTLRRVLGPWPAILTSAILFAALHRYSLAAFLSVTWSGVLLAYAFERSRSLLPGIAIHSAGNLLALSPVLLFYR